MLLSKKGSYELHAVDPGTPEWQQYHEIQRVVLFEQTLEEYDGLSHDSYFCKPAHRTPLLLKFNGLASSITTLDNFQDGSAATRCVATAFEMQRRGHGRVLGGLIEDFARAKNIEKLVVNAGYKAVGFYQSRGFSKDAWDPQEIEGHVGAPIIQMSKMISAP